MQGLLKLLLHLKTKNWLVLSILWAMLITVLSCIPGSEIPDSKLLEYDKIGHFGVYAILSFLIFGWKWRQYSEEKQGWKLYTAAIIWSGILGIILEFMQGYVLTGRYFDLLDVIANIIGSITGAVFASWILNKQEL